MKNTSLIANTCDAQRVIHDAQQSTLAINCWFLSALELVGVIHNSMLLDSVLLLLPGSHVSFLHH
jgi:hypothetical protein